MWKMPEEDRITNIHTVFAANGWRAVYVVRESEWPEGQYIRQEIPLISFALMEYLETEECQIVGMIPDGVNIIPCVTEHFLGYLAAGEDIDNMDMIAAQNEWLARRAEAERLKFN